MCDFLRRIGASTSDAVQPRQNAQRVFAIHQIAILLAEYRVDALGMLGSDAIRKISAVQDLRYRNELGERGQRSSQRDLRGVIVEAIELGLNRFAVNRPR